MDAGVVSCQPVIDTFVREVDETYTITIDGVDIETTAEHPFYSVEDDENTLIRIDNGHNMKLELRTYNPAYMVEADFTGVILDVAITWLLWVSTIYALGKARQGVPMIQGE